jgi:hypothetical protein
VSRTSTPSDPCLPKRRSSSRLVSLSTSNQLSQVIALMYSLKKNIQKGVEFVTKA